MSPVTPSSPSNRFLPLTDVHHPPSQQQHDHLSRPPSEHDQQPLFNFSALLPELRLEVYEHLFLFPARSTLHSIFRASPWVVPCLAVSHEMREAGLRTIYARTQLHLDLVSYQFAAFESVASGADPEASLHRPLLVLGRRGRAAGMSVNPPGVYDSAQFYGRCVAPLPASLFRPECVRDVSVAVYLGLYRDDIEAVSMKVVFKMLYRLTHGLMPNLERVCLRVAGGNARGAAGAKGWTATLLASGDGEDQCLLSGKNGERRRQRWLDSLPHQIGRLPVKARELQLEGVSDEVFEVIAKCARVSR